MMKDFINMITIQTYKKFPDRTFGLGQDVSTDLLDIVRVPALFIKDSKIHKELEETRLKQVTLDAGAPKEIYDKLLNALSKDDISDSELVSLGSKYGRKPYASGLIRAIFDGQRGPAIKDWPAKNYLAVAVGMGLVDLDYTTDTYHITDLGKEAVALLDKNDLDNLRNFMLERLYEYPYAAWLIRVVNTDRNKWYTKFDLGDNFGFIDEPGFSSLPEDLYVDAMFEAEYSKNKKFKSQIKSNYESTADKYMRWLAGVLVKYNLLERKKKVYTRIIDGKEYSVSLTSYKVTLQGVRSLNRVNGGSRFSRSIKRVRWEYLAPKVENASKRKTARALMLKLLSEAPNGMTAEDMSVKINAINSSLNSIADQVLDDAKGLNRLGIEISIDNKVLKLKEKLYDFIIPVKNNETFDSTVADNLKNLILPKLKELDHKYLQAIDIAYKRSNTTNHENTLLEVLSADLFTKEMDYHGKHLGGANKPDGFVYDEETGWILDSKAYRDGFAVTAHTTDAMGRYIDQYRDRDDKSTWWEDFPKDLPQTYFAYVSGFYIGKYQEQLQDFENRKHMKGGLIEVAKLILLAEKYKENKITHDQITRQILNDHISQDEYIKDF